MKLGVLTASASRKGGGVFEVTSSLSKALIQKNHSVKVFSIRDEYTDKDRSLWGKVSINDFQATGPSAIGYAPQFGTAIKNFQLDLIHSHGIWMYPSKACHAWSRRERKPYIVSPHGMLDPWAIRNSRWKKKLAGFLYEHAHLRDANCIHALCEAEARAIREYGLRNPICVIPNGVHLPVVTSESREAPWEKYFPKDRKIILYLGRLHPKKGLINLLKGWASIYHKFIRKNNWSLVIAGWSQNKHETELKCLASELSINDTVFFSGPLFGKKKEDAFSKASAFILPSVSEGLPLVVLEAWSYGLPVLMTKYCNLSEGFTTQAAIRIGVEADHIAIRLCDFISLSDSERQSFGRNGRNLVTNRFDWNNIATEMDAVYHWLLGGITPSCIEYY